MQLLRLQKDLRAGSISRDIVNYMRRRLGAELREVFGEVIYMYEGFTKLARD